MYTKRHTYYLFLLFILISTGHGLPVNAQIGPVGDQDYLNVTLRFLPSTIQSGGTSQLSLVVGGNLGPVTCSFVGLPQPQGIVSPPITFGVTSVIPLSVSALCEEQQVFDDIPPLTGFANTQLNISGPIVPPL